MKCCSNRMDEIAECALGKRAAPDFAAHLAICPLCRNALQESLATAARIDEALHRVAAVEPPVYGPERALARIVSAPIRGQGPRRWWGWAAVAGLVWSVLIAIVIWVRHPAPVAESAALTAWRSPTQSLLRPPVAAVWSATPRLGEEYFKIKP
jgi:predicted anti-sigma-YlaC factor YlaD